MHFFDVLLHTAFKPFHPLCSTSGGNTDRQCSLLWHQWEIQTRKVPPSACPTYKPQWNPHPASFTCPPKIFLDQLGRPAMPSPKPHHNRPFNTLLGCVWHHQPQHLYHVLPTVGHRQHRHSALHFTRASHFIVRETEKYESWLWDSLAGSG